jgi:hypothetical protein
VRYGAITPDIGSPLTSNLGVRGSNPFRRARNTANNELPPSGDARAIREGDALGTQNVRCGHSSRFDRPGFRVPPSTAGSSSSNFPQRDLSVVNLDIDAGRLAVDRWFSRGSLSRPLD